MNLENYKQMDPFILYSAINMKLRDESIKLDELCKVYDLDLDELVKILSKAGFTYDKEVNQFR